MANSATNSRPRKRSTTHKGHKRRQPTKSVRVGRISVYPMSGAWYGRWTDAAGNRHAQKLDTARDRAVRRAKAIDGAVAAGYLGTHPDQPLRRTLVSLLEEYETKLARGAGEKHVATVLNALRRCFNTLQATRIRDITPNGLEGYLDQRGAGGNSAGTLGHHRGYIKSFFKWAYETDRIPHNPAKGLEARSGPVVRRRQANSSDEIARIVAAADEGPHPYERPAVRLGYWNGLRKGEILNLRWGDVEIGACPDCRGTGHIAETECVQCGGSGRSGLYRITEDRQKGKKDTVVPMHPDLVEYLEAYRRETEAELGRAVGATDLIVRGAPKAARTHSKHRKALCIRAGVPYENLLKERCDWHSMRHSFVTLLGTNPELDINTKRLLARHADIKTTTKYDHSDIRRQRAGLTRVRVVDSPPPHRPNSPAPAAAPAAPTVLRVHHAPQAAGGE